jgi:hypothetical protein
VALTRWRMAVGAAAVAAVLVPAAMSWACVAPVSMTIEGNASVQPGGKVTVLLREYAQGAPIEVRLHSPTGPVLGVHPPPTTTMTSEHKLEVTIPPDLPYGTHLLVSTQNYHHMNSGNIGRATVYVGTLPPAPAGPEPRPALLEVGSGPSAVTLTLIALGVAGGLLLLAAVWSMVGSGRRTEPEPQPVKK